MINTITFNPAITTENSGFVFIENEDLSVNTIDVRVMPDSVIGYDTTVGGENMVYWVALLRDEFGVPTPNQPVRIRAMGVVTDGGAPVVHNDIPVEIWTVGGLLSDFMGKVAGRVAIPKAFDNYTVVTSEPIVLCVEYYPNGEWNGSDAPVVYGNTEIWVKE